VNMLIL